MGEDPVVAIFDGEIRDAEAITVPITSEAALRGANVFDGMRAYVDRSRLLRVLQPTAHLQRLLASAQLLAIAHELSIAALARSIALLLEHAELATDSYVRPSILVLEGRNPTDKNYRAVDYVAVASAPRRDLRSPARAIVSTYRKSQCELLPSRAKAGGSYLQFRLASQERLAAGVEHVIVVNQFGRIAEAEGAAVLVVDDGVLVSPPQTEGALPSITWATVRALAREIGIPTKERPLDRSDLIDAEAVILAGTLCELVPLASIGETTYDPASCRVVEALSDAFDRVRNGTGPGDIEYLTTEELLDLR